MHARVAPAVRPIRGIRRTATATRIAQIVPVFAKDDDCGGEHALPERRPAGDPLGPKRSASDPPRVGPEHPRSEPGEDVQRRRLGPMGQIEEQDGERDDGQPVTVRRDPGGEQQARRSIGLRQRACGVAGRTARCRSAYPLLRQGTETKRDAVGDTHDVAPTDSQTPSELGSQRLGLSPSQRLLSFPPPWIPPAPGQPRHGRVARWLRECAVLERSAFARLWA